MKKVRLDQLVFDLGLTESRERAKTTIMSGVVFVNGQRADKPGMAVAPDAKVEIHGETLPFVSRGGYKLDKALRVFPVDPAGKVCIDCGASTGGFTDCLVQHGAALVYAVLSRAELPYNEEISINLSFLNSTVMRRASLQDELAGMSGIRPVRPQSGDFACQQSNHQLTP